MTSFTGVSKPEKVSIGIRLPNGRVSLLLELDASEREEHVNDAEVTDFPVESGGNVADHIRTKPETLELSGVITTRPVAILARERLRGVRGGPIATADVDAHAEFLRWQREGLILVVRTTLREYDNMVLQRFRVPRNARLGRTWRGTLSFRQVLTANTELVEAPEPIQLNQAPKSNKGRQNSKPSKPEAESQMTGDTGTSFLGDLINSVFDGS